MEPDHIRAVIVGAAERRLADDAPQGRSVRNAVPALGPGFIREREEAMPEKLKRKLKATARKRGYGEERTGAYVYGTLAKIEKKKRKHNPGKCGKALYT
jgi:hypothetical protein